MNEATGILSRFTLELGRIGLLAGESVRSLFTIRPRVREVLAQMHFIGIKSQTVVIITGAFAGMVLCLQTFYQFQKIKMGAASLSVVSVGMTGEMGPVLTGLMVAGRVGAAITAQIGTMRVTEQIDALRTMATHPVDYLVVPRVAAAVIVMPLLTIQAMVVGIVAAYFMGVNVLGMDGAYSIKYMVYYTEPIDVVMGVTKAIIFGGIIAVVGCHKGLNCGAGAEGVGRATNEAVVHACVIIMISNLFITMAMRSVLLTFGWM